MKQKARDIKEAEPSQSRQFRRDPLPQDEHDYSVDFLIAAAGDVAVVVVGDDDGDDDVQFGIHFQRLWRFMADLSLSLSLWL